MQYAFHYMYYILHTGSTSNMLVEPVSWAQNLRLLKFSTMLFNLILIENNLL